VLRDLRTLYHVGILTGLTDRELLERFQSANQGGDREGAELVLAALIERHAPMVWSVCRAHVCDPHDAEDAFQATFLILVRKAGSLRLRETLGSWLYVVAHRTALSIRSAAARRRAVERAAAVERSESTNSPGLERSPDLDEDDLAIIHTEILRLPAPARTVLLLCDLEGLSYRQAAERLNLPLGTIQSRLARARGRLRRSLIRQGIHMPASSGSGDYWPNPMLADLGAVWLSPSLIQRVIRLCVTVACDPARTGTMLTGSVQSLIQGGLRSMFLGKMKRVLLSLAGGVLVCGTLWQSVAKSGQPQQEEPRPASRPHPEIGPIRWSTAIPAPRQVRVTAGRGDIRAYALDEKGERITEQVKKKSRNRGPMMGGMMGMMGQAARKKRNRIETVFKEETRDVRWVVVTGVIDHRRIQWWWRCGHRAVPSTRIYCRVDLQRKALQKDGSWSEWEAVDPMPTLEILDNSPEVEEERTPNEVRLSNLVDPLPFLKSGRWSGVDVEQFIPKAPTPVKPAEEPQPGPPGMMGQADVLMRRVDTPPEDEPRVLMLRTLDFTVEPSRTYRYRSRVVAFNPDNQPGPGPGGQRKKKNMPGNVQRPKTVPGPWSDATEIVTVP
jgi:RNA polymerase sigma factor (sigma-70 family)